jgi:hypothetical protein
MAAIVSPNIVNPNQVPMPVLSSSLNPPPTWPLPAGDWAILPPLAPTTWPPNQPPGTGLPTP